MTVIDNIICYSDLTQGIYCDIPGLEFISPEPKAFKYLDNNTKMSVYIPETAGVYTTILSPIGTS